MAWFKRSRTPQPVETTIDPPVTAEEIAIAYRVVLDREPDADGLQSYLALGRDTGFTLAEAIRSLKESNEYRARVASPGPAPHSTASPASDLIRPADVIAAHTLQELIDTAEEYYRRVPDAAPLMSKPFAWWHETPQMLQDLGALFSGMSLGRSMTVLDFGGGTGWLTRILAQLNCQAICCDVSASALEIGRALFEQHPPIGTAPYRPIFLRFDGVTIDLPDASVDRVVCFDAFHHVPNPARVIAEIGRVLKPGGIAGFSEPGPQHSQSPQSQYEMRHHKVLENDIDLNQIAAMAGAAGFTSVRVKALVDRDLSLDEYNALFDRSAPGRDALRAGLWNDTAHTMSNRSVFFLHEGDAVRDSRSHIGLAHRLTVLSAPASVPVGKPFHISIEATNTGEALWLHQNTEIFGIVRLGSHLYDDAGALRSLDFSRHDLPRQIAPGEAITVEAPVVINSPGHYRLQFDLVAEGVTWFENVGSKAVEVVIVVS